MKMAPRLTTRSLLKPDKIAELFSGLFYVAASRLNSPRELSRRIEPSVLRRVKPVNRRPGRISYQFSLDSYQLSNVI
jgi:hypothetical protein